MSTAHTKRVLSRKPKTETYSKKPSNTNIATITTIQANTNMATIKAVKTKKILKKPVRPTAKQTAKQTIMTTVETLQELPTSTIQEPLQGTTSIIPIQDNSKDTNNVSLWDNLFAQIQEPIPEGSVQDETLHHIPDKPDSLDPSQTSTRIRVKDYLDMECSIVVTSKKSNECPSCKGKLNHNGNKLICQSCGLVIDDTSGATDEQYTTSSLADCNVSDKGYMSMKFIGRGAYGNNRSLLKSCAKYDQYRNMTTRKDVHNWNSQSTDKHLPKNVIEEACNMFAKIKAKGYVYRKDVKKGVLSACIYYACYNNGISKTPNEIASLVGIAEKFHSMGDRILRDLNERGVIELPDKIDPVVDYVIRYMEVLGIDKKYKDFVLDIIYVADREKLHVLSDSKNNTKCIGAIYLLIDRVPELRKTIDKDKIDNDCEISKTTFIKYYNLICKFYRKFVPTFVKHGVPMKPEWKEDIADILANGIPETTVEPGKRKKYAKKHTDVKTKVPPRIPLNRQKKKPVLEDKSIDESVSKISSSDTTQDLYNKPIKRVAKLPAKYASKKIVTCVTNNAPAQLKKKEVDIASPKSDTTDTSHDSYIAIKKKFTSANKFARTGMPIRLKS